jgi:hypothetical protein
VAAADYTLWPGNVTTGTATITGLTAATGYMFKVTAYNDTGSADSNVYSATTRPALSKLENIEAALQTNIDAMTTAGGYWFTWGLSNQPDKAKKTGLVNAEIYDITEENLDSINASGSGAYTNPRDYEIRINGNLETISNTPQFAIKATLSRALSDIKRLIPRIQSLNGYANIVEYRGERRDYYHNGDIINPGNMAVTVRVHYTQDRQYPENN